MSTVSIATQGRADGLPGSVSFGAPISRSYDGVFSGGQCVIEVPDADLALDPDGVAECTWSAPNATPIASETFSVRGSVTVPATGGIDCAHLLSSVKYETLTGASATELSATENMFILLEHWDANDVYVPPDGSETVVSGPGAFTYDSINNNVTKWLYTPNGNEGTVVFRLAPADSAPGYCDIPMPVSAAAVVTPPPVTMPSVGISRYNRFGLPTDTTGFSVENVSSGDSIIIDTAAKAAAISNTIVNLNGSHVLGGVKIQNTTDVEINNLIVTTPESWLFNYRASDRSNPEPVPILIRNNTRLKLNNINCEHGHRSVLAQTNTGLKIRGLAVRQHARHGFMSYRDKVNVSGGGAEWSGVGTQVEGYICYAPTTPSDNGDTDHFSFFEPENPLRQVGQHFLKRAVIGMGREPSGSAFITDGASSGNPEHGGVLFEDIYAFDVGNKVFSFAIGRDSTARRITGVQLPGSPNQNVSSGNVAFYVADFNSARSESSQPNFINFRIEDSRFSHYTNGAFRGFWIPTENAPAGSPGNGKPVNFFGHPASSTTLVNVDTNANLDRAAMLAEAALIVADVPAFNYAGAAVDDNLHTLY